MNNKEKKKINFATWVPIIVIILTLSGSIWTWTANEKRLAEEFERKEARYTKLIDTARGFYSVSTNKALQLEFLKQVDLCWLYCPDDVIKKAYAFLFSVHTETTGKYSPEQLEAIQKKSLQEFVLSVREDLISRKQIKKTKLKSEDFQILKTNN